MSEQGLVLIWLSFLVAMIAMTVIGTPDMVKSVVKDLVKILLELFRRGP